MEIYPALLEIHSLLRWLVIVLLIIVAVKSLAGWINKYDYRRIDDKLAVYTLIFIHVQFLLGLVLFFISPIVRSGLQDMAAAMKSPEIRFWTVEHSIGMLAAIILATIGRISSKRKPTALVKHRTVSVYFILSLVFIILMIPWERV